MNTQQLPYILAIASTGSLSKAARQLHVSQPALSKYLSQLEQQVGMDLFLRYKKRLYPTPAGKLYIEAAREILGLMVRTKDAIRLLGSPGITELHLGISPHRGALMTAHIFPAFMQYCPQIRLIPHEGYALELKDMVQNQLLDFAMTSCSGRLEEELRFIPLFHEEIVLGVPAFHRLAQKFHGTDSLPFLSLEDFRDSSFIMTEAPSALADATKPLFAAAAFHPLTAFSSPNIVLAEAMIRSGAGVGFLPASYMKKDSGLTYFRLPSPAFLTSGILCRTCHIFSKEERFFIFLHLQHNSKIPDYQVTWDEPFIQELIQEFDYTHDLSYLGETSL